MSIVTLPAPGAVHRNHTERPSVPPHEGAGSPGSIVALAFVPVADVFNPVTVCASAKSSLVGGKSTGPAVSGVSSSPMLLVLLYPSCPEPP